jgi:hypothetical protein
MAISQRIEPRTHYFSIKLDDTMAQRRRTIKHRGAFAGGAETVSALWAAVSARQELGAAIGLGELRG